MDYTVKKRKTVYNKFVKGLSDDNNGKTRLQLEKTKLLGKGYQGVVYSFCSKDKKLCVAVKKMYLENRQARFLKKPFTIPALKYENFIELASMKLTNEIILQNICPHFILHYKSISYPRELGVCSDLYTHTSRYYNELIDDAESYTSWVKRSHTLDEWYNAYFQITVAIYCLQRHFNMIHLDLHSDNILIKKVKPGGQWKYKIDGKDYYVPNYGFILYVNDFGHAWIPNNFQSWIVRKRYKTKRIHRNFDILKLFNSTLEFSTSPASFKNHVKKMIKDLGGDTNFVHIIESIWSDYLVKKRRKTLESYDLDKQLQTKNLPPDLRHLSLVGTMSLS
jgi:hypothetical protein